MHTGSIPTQDNVATRPLTLAEINEAMSGWTNKKDG